MNTTEDVEKVTHLALEQTQGNITQAAKLLGLTSVQLNNRITNNKNLKVRWRKGKSNPKPPDESITLNRPALPADEEPNLPLATEVSVAEAMKREDADVRKGFGAMGLSDKETDLAESLKNFQRSHYKSSLQMIGGGITKQFIRVMVQIQEIEERLADGKRETDFPLTLQEEAMLRDHHTKLLDILGKFHEKANKSVLIQAKVVALLKGKNKDNPGKRPKGILDLESANA